MSIGSFSARRRTTILVSTGALLAALPLASQAAPPIIPPPPKPKPAATAPAADSAAKAASGVAAAPAPPAPTATATPTDMSDADRVALRGELERQLKALADSLKLTPDQRAQARPILLDQAYQLRQIRQKYAAQEKTPANQEAMKKEVQQLRDATDHKLGAVFTVHQMEQFKAKREAWLGQAKARPAAPGTANAAAGAAPAAGGAHAAAPADTTKK